MEADFFQYFGLDITQMGSSGLSYARVQRLLLRLPYESRLFRALLGVPTVWTMENEQLASIYDAIAILAWQNENEGKKRHQQSDRPERYPRPGDIDKRKEEQARESELGRRLLEQKARLIDGNNIQD